MKKVLAVLLFLFLLNQISNAQTGWFIQPSFTAKNLYDCKQSAVANLYAGSDSGTIFRSTNNGYNWSVYNFNDPLISNSPLKFVMGDNGDNWFTVGGSCAYGTISSPTTEDIYSIHLSYAYLICGANGTILRCYEQSFNTWYKQIS